MADEERIRHRIEARLDQGQFLMELLRVARDEVADTQSQFVQTLGAAAYVRTVLDDNGLIRRAPYEPAAYWPSVAGRTYGFIDGGVANLEIPSAGPVGIRVGSYVVKPGSTDEEREQFSIETSLVDDFYSQNPRTYDSDYTDPMTLSDAARIACEAGAALSLVSRKSDLDAVLLHGPLVNPAAPYGLVDFPAFTLETSRRLLCDLTWEGDEQERGFPALMRTLLHKLKDTHVPVAGVVERAKGSNAPLVTRVFAELRHKGTVTEEAWDDLERTITAFNVNDTRLLDVVLNEGEYLSPVLVNRQGSEGKWPKGWMDEIRGHPLALSTFVKPSDSSQPFRVEAFEDVRDFDGIIALIVHTSRLLPSYGFPVGLDIVDRYAKVPAWMSKGVRSRHSVGLLRTALASGDPRALAFAKRMLASKGRDWLFRPTA